MAKYSRQREEIIENLSKRYDHPTAETVYLELKKNDPGLSLGTVYRNLSKLAESGEIQKLSSENGPDRFDYNNKPHCHFFCKNCGKVIDLNLEINDILVKEASQVYGGEVEKSIVSFVGLCSECKAK